MNGRPLDHRAWLLVTVFFCLLTGCSTGDESEQTARYRAVEGATMGTYYRVQYRQQHSCAVTQQELDARLLAFNQSLSTYIKDSEISAFNRAPADSWQALSPRLLSVLQAALEIWRESDGAFDVTIGPLVNLWGFGPVDVTELPTAQEQQITARWVGMKQLQLDRANASALKQSDEVYVDLSALAKGLGVDELADYLTNKGCTDYMVDIGGEMRTLGQSPSSRPWLIGIEKPVAGAMGSIQRVLSVSGQAVATSGDYRNFRKVDGIRVDHVIDPRSGRPADNEVASVTVVHPEAMFADAWATAIMVLGSEAGLGAAQRLNIPVLIIEKSADGEFLERYTPAMAAYFVAASSSPLSE